MQAPGLNLIYKSSSNFFCDVPLASLYAADSWDLNEVCDVTKEEKQTLRVTKMAGLGGGSDSSFHGYCIMLGLMVFRVEGLMLHWAAEEIMPPQWLITGGETEQQKKRRTQKRAAEEWGELLVHRSLMNILIDGIISVMIIKCVAHQAALRANVVETEGLREL